MSFILDALKKSETDRQRQNGPALFEVRVAPPRNGLPVWAVGLAVLLAVNLVIVAWVLLRRPAAAEVANAAPPQGTASQPYAGATQGQAMQYPPPPGPPAGSPGAQQGQNIAPVTGTVTVAGTAPTSPLAQTAGMTQPAPAYTAGALSPAGSQLPAGANDVRGGQSDATGQRDAAQLNPDDYAPATDAPAPGAFGNHVTRGTSSGVPLYQDAALAAGTHLPELRLDLHVFAAKPQDRFVMINMHKLHEGDSLPEGVRVESITPEGAVMSKDGSRFLLPRD
jgi:general secretion pathway protein B